jgi:lysophospholipase L1-like esterase
LEIERVCTSLKNNQTVLFIGDSITGCDRQSPEHSPLGWGYVRMFSDIISVREPEKTIRIINKGVNQNTITHLLSRWCDDVLEFQPDVLFVLIGINDATRYLDHSPSLHCSADKFRIAYERLVAETHLRLPHCQIYLMQPFFISKGDDIVESYRNRLISTLADYQRATEETVQEFGLTLVPLAEEFKRLLRTKTSDTFSEDKIHPNHAGHFAIAEAAYRSLESGERLHV